MRPSRPWSWALIIESSTWLRLIIRARLLDSKRIADLLDECLQLADILGQSIVTAKKNQPTRGKSNS